jgi:hypothetical protein
MSDVCNQFKGQTNQQDVSDTQRKLQDVKEIAVGTATAPFSDREVGISMMGEMVATAALTKLANQGAKNISKIVLKKLVSSFGGLTDIGDYLDIMDVLIGDKYTMIVDQETFQMLFNGAKQKYKDIITQEFKNCLYDTFKKNYPQLTEQQVRNLVLKVTSMTTVSSSIPSKVDAFSFQKDCFPTQKIDNQNYFKTTLGPTCPLLYRQYFDKFVQQNRQR